MTHGWPWTFWDWGGVLDTELALSNNGNALETFNVKCFNENGVRIGPVVV